MDYTHVAHLIYKILFLENHERKLRKWFGIRKGFEYIIFSTNIL
jgi:hypothetical protein